MDERTEEGCIVSLETEEVQNPGLLGKDLNEKL